MKKLLFIPLHFEHQAQQDFYKSFCKQYIVQYYQNNQIAIEFNPDIIYTQCGAIDTNLLKELKEKTGALVIQWTGNTRADILDEVMIFKDVADITFLASGIGQRDMYEAVLKHPVRYLQHGMAEWNFLPVQENIVDKKIIFIGNNYDHFEGAVERNKLCEVLTSTFENFEVWGNGFAEAKYRNPDSIPYNDTPVLYNKSYIGIAANCFNDIEGYWCNRKLDIMAAGSCCLMRYVPKMENHFKDGIHGLFYKTNEEAIEKIRYLLENPDVRNKIAYQGQEITRKYHTLDYRAFEIKEALKEFGK